MEPQVDRKGIHDAAEMLLVAIEGMDVPELVETPRRVADAWAEMMDGYDVDIPSLFKAFDGIKQNGLAIATDIDAWSVCRHHLLPFHITVSVGYIPQGGKVIGLSKLERLVYAFAHRLQLQETIGEQVAEALMEGLKPEGVAVVIKGEHLCMRARGVKDSRSRFVTSVMLGQFREEASLRAEFLELIR